MRAWLRKSWPILKVLFTVAIIIAIGRQFARDLNVWERGLVPALQDLWSRIHRPGWLVASGVLYLLALGSTATYWYRLLRDFGQHPSFYAAIRAHYVGQMGKYLPGKAWALLVRSGMVRGTHVHVGIAVLTSFFEVLAAMATGALFAAVLFATQISDLSAPLDWHAFERLLPRNAPLATPIDPRVAACLAVLLLGPVGFPILPPVFNWLAHRIARPFRQADAGPLPRTRIISLLEALVFATVCWLFMGASLWAVLHAIVPDPPPLTLARLADYTAFISLSYVAGFLMLMVPSGLGVREYFLLLFLIPEINSWIGTGEADARATAALAVILLRLVWTAAELVVVAIVYRLPGASVPSRAALTGAGAAPPENQALETTEQS